MDDKEFEKWLETLVKKGRLSSEQKEDLSKQRELFNSRRQEIEERFGGYVVGFINDSMLVTDNVQGLLEQVRELRLGARQVYFEPVSEALANSPDKIRIREAVIH